MSQIKQKGKSLKGNFKTKKIHQRQFQILFIEVLWQFPRLHWEMSQTSFNNLILTFWSGYFESILSSLFLVYLWKLTSISFGGLAISPKTREQMQFGTPQRRSNDFFLLSCASFVVFLFGISKVLNTVFIAVKTVVRFFWGKACSSVEGRLIVCDSK